MKRKEEDKEEICGLYGEEKKYRVGGGAKERHHLGDLSMDMRDNIKTSLKEIVWKSVD
jgi:hypothetical protein